VNAICGNNSCLSCFLHALLFVRDTSVPATDRLGRTQVALPSQTGPESLWRISPHHTHNAGINLRTAMPNVNALICYFSGPDTRKCPSRWWENHYSAKVGGAQLLSVSSARYAYSAGRFRFRLPELESEPESACTIRFAPTLGVGTWMSALYAYPNRSLAGAGNCESDHYAARVKASLQLTRNKYGV
jgi:hypothetical protein